MNNRHLLVIAAVALLAGFAPHSAKPARWALLIGISDYTHFGDEIGGDLPGAVNDARAWRDVLVARHGFPEQNVRMLLDAEATRAGIEAAMTEWLATNAKSGDHVFIMFAGHGSQMWDTDGDEEDGLDETICPVDVTKGSTDRDISDDEIARWLEAVPTNDIVVFWDKCHAESSTRAATPFARPRSLDRSVAQDVARPANATSEARTMVAGERTAESVRKQILEFAASQSDEVAVDAAWPLADGSTLHGGAFTTLAVRNLWNAPRGTSYRAVFEQTRQDMKRERFAQTPSLNGPAGERIAFALQSEAAFAAAPGSAPDVAGVPIRSVSGGEVVLGAGSAAGLVSGMVYRAGATQLVVTDVGADRARARIANGDAAAVASGARAQLVAAPLPSAVLRVSVADLSAAQRAALDRELAPGAAQRIALQSEAQRFAHLIVRPRGAELVVLGLDGATRHVVPSAAQLATVLVRELGAHALAQLENPARPFPLEFSLAGEKTTFRVGEAISFRVRAPRAGYLTIVDLGTDGTVTVLYPNPYVQDGRVAAGQEVVLPDAAMRADEVVFEAQEPVGRGIVRAFLTGKPLALPSSHGDASLAAAVADALRGATGARGTEPLPVGNWATAALVYEIVK